MRSYIFNEYVDGKDGLNENWFQNWFSKPTVANQSNTPAIGANTQQPVIPQRRNAKLASMDQQPPTAGTGGIPVTRTLSTKKPERVVFSANDFRQVQVAMSDYLGIIERYKTFVLQTLGQYSGDINNAFKRIVSPSKNTMRELINLIKNEIGELRNNQNNQRESYEYFLESIKIGHTIFEKIKLAMQNMGNAMSEWNKFIFKHIMLDSNQTQRLTTAYKDNVVLKQGALAQQLLWIDKKLQKLMNIHGRQYEPIVGQPRGQNYHVAKYR